MLLFLYYISSSLLSLDFSFAFLLISSLFYFLVFHQHSFLLSLLAFHRFYFLHSLYFGFFSSSLSLLVFLLQTLNSHSSFPPQTEPHRRVLQGTVAQPDACGARHGHHLCRVREVLRIPIPAQIGGPASRTFHSRAGPAAYRPRATG